MENSKSIKWSIIFLGITSIAIIMELIASFDSSPNTIPWTSYIINYIPSYIGLPIVIIFASWLVHHFYYWYKENSK